MDNVPRRRYIDGLVENFKELQAVHLELCNDVANVVPDLVMADADDLPSKTARLTSFERRSVLRAIFSCIEASSFHMRKHLVLHNGDLLSPELALALKELQVDVSGSGVVTTKPLKVSALSLLRLTVKVFGECYEPLDEYNLKPTKCEGVDFEKMIPSFKVRDRITHPKRISDLTITDEELLNAVTAFRWFNRFVIDSIGLIAGHTLSDAKNFEERIKVLNKQIAQYDEEKAQLESRFKISH
ncbi:hypothetical protein ACI2KS_10835 [Pseudomonas sp. NPDC087358]|uniref:hypothetical protein n=1 Tax=Pseudomonas sp. NPDC087358 TaxID=3364439 RepID=UPI00384DACCC